MTLVGTPQTFLKPASSGGGASSPYTLVNDVQVPVGATYVVMSISGWTSGDDLTILPTFGGTTMGLVGSVNGFVGAAPRSRILELAISPSQWGTTVDVVVQDTAYSFVQHGYLIFHNGGPARTITTFRDDTDGSDVPLQLTDVFPGDVVIMASTSRNTADAAITYTGIPSEVVSNHWPDESQQFSIHTSYIASAQKNQSLGGTDALSAGGGGTVDWRSFIAVALPNTPRFSGLPYVKTSNVVRR